MTTLFDTTHDRIAEEFEDFNREHPQVYESFKRYTLQLRNAGVQHGSARDVLGRVRWETQVNPAYANRAEFKVNNNYAAIMARKVMDELPAMRGFFQTRERKSVAA